MLCLTAILINSNHQHIGMEGTKLTSWNPLGHSRPVTGLLNHGLIIKNMKYKICRFLNVIKENPKILTTLGEYIENAYFVLEE